MPVNADKVTKWKADIAASVDLYNDWFMRFAPQAFRETRVETTKKVANALRLTANLTNITPIMLVRNPRVLSTLRMSTCPPLARDRLAGLARVDGSLVSRMEDDGTAPPRMEAAEVNKSLASIGKIIGRLVDPDIFVWLQPPRAPTPAEAERAATIVADRLCGAEANPIIRNAQEKRQLDAIAAWLTARGYKPMSGARATRFGKMPSGTFAFRLNVPVKLGDGKRQVNIPVDTVVMPKTARPGDLPLLIEAKSAGDFTNVNKRRKEEAAKMGQLKSTYATRVRYVLFLCGYFDSGYLGYEAAEGIDWVWEHRIDDLRRFGL